MPEFHNKEMLFYQNLIDAGCNEQNIEECLVMYKNMDEKKLTQQLSLYRKSLLDDLHRVQHKIDCLDYLLYQLKTNKSGGKL